jgi:hypothetical protein
LQDQQCRRLGQRFVLALDLSFQTLDLLAIFTPLLLFVGGDLLATALRFDGSITPCFDLLLIKALAAAIFSQFGFGPRRCLHDDSKFGLGGPVLTGAVMFQHGTSFLA